MFPLPWYGFVVGLCLEDCRLLWQIGVSFLFSDNCPCVIVFFEIKSCVCISKNKIPLFVGASWLLDILGAWMSGVMKFIHTYMCVCWLFYVSMYNLGTQLFGWILSGLKLA